MSSRRYKQSVTGTFSYIFPCVSLFRLKNKEYFYTQKPIKEIGKIKG